MLIDILKESYLLLNEMSVYLLFGFTAAGILHVLISQDMVMKNLNKKGFWSVVKASILGIPLPLCSCAVIPAAVSIKKAGAGRGAVLSFLISTPATGVDSILITYSLLGSFFAVFRVVFSFITAVFAGIVADSFITQPLAENKQESSSCGCADKKKDNMFIRIIKHMLTITDDTWKSLLLGVLAGGVVSYLVPDAWISELSGNTILSMLIMCFVSVPLYICASSSVPIAAVLIMKGLSPGAAFVFLLAGPATNTATISVVLGQLGIKTLIIYLFSIVFCSIGSGLFINYLWKIFQIDFLPQLHEHGTHADNMWGTFFSVCLIGLIVISIISKRKKTGV